MSNILQVSESCSSSSNFSSASFSSSSFSDKALCKINVEHLENASINKNMNFQNKSEMSYICPSWAKIPEKLFWLEVIRDNCFIEKIKLQNKNFFIIGSQKDKVDIFYQNPCVSRQHAVIQFNDVGEAYILDLFSTHGTYLNNEKIPCQEYIKLDVGCIIRCGKETQSKRHFIFCGVIEEDEKELKESNKEKDETVEIIKEEGNISREKISNLEGERQDLLRENAKKQKLTSKNDKIKEKKEDKIKKKASDNKNSMSEEEKINNFNDDSSEDDFFSEGRNILNYLKNKNKYEYDTSLFSEDDEFFDRTTKKNKVLISKNENQSDSVDGNEVKNTIDDVITIRAKLENFKLQENNILNELNDLDKKQTPKGKEEILSEEREINQTEHKDKQDEEDDTLDLYMNENAKMLKKNQTKKLEETLMLLRQKIKLNEKYLKILEK